MISDCRGFVGCCFSNFLQRGENFVQATTREPPKKNIASVCCRSQHLSNTAAELRGNKLSLSSGTAYAQLCWLYLLHAQLRALSSDFAQLSCCRRYSALSVTCWALRAVAAAGNIFTGPMLCTVRLHAVYYYVVPMLKLHIFGKVSLFLKIDILSWSIRKWTVT